MKTGTWPAFAIALVALAPPALVPTGGAAQTPPRQPHQFLETNVGFTEPDFQALDRGEVVAKVLQTGDKEEVAVFGIVWIDAPMADFVRWQRDIESFETGEAVEAIRKLSDPPRLSDFDALSFPEEDLDDLRKCRVGKCEVKATAESLTRIQNEVDWKAPDAREQANRLIRQMLFEFTE